MNELIKEKIQLLPNSPGVYIMKDNTGKIIYVGKAVVLRNRVRQYFQNKQTSVKVQAMVKHIADFELIITASEVEALILECNLIKKHRPKYNISLKDDKSYPYLKVTLQEDFPRVSITRKVLRDGAKYYGPYTNVNALQESYSLIKKLFPLRSCKKMDASRPCLEYHIKRCLAPCKQLVDKEAYQNMINKVCLFLDGRTNIVEESLSKEMEEAAENWDFERAAGLRDQLFAIKKISEKQSIITGAGDQDAIGMARSAAGVCVQIFYIRSGKMVGRDNFFLAGSEDEADDELLAAFLKQYYHQASFVPKELLLPFSLGEGELLEKWLAEKKGSGVYLTIPKRGTKRDIVEMAIGNARKALVDEGINQERKFAKTLGAAEELGKALGLLKTPYRMECFDISHMQGSETVASMVVFEGGMAKKSDYRRFKIRSAEGKPDDFKSMREVTTRRYGKADATLPDLIIIDGGKGQLSSALEIIRGAGHLEVPVVGLAKREEEIFLEGQGEPVVLPRSSQALFLIQRIRDEAHRFAITYHRTLRKKRNMVSILDHIQGIGPKRRKILLSEFTNIEGIKKATVEELANIDGMNRPTAVAVYNFFQALDRKV